MCNGGELSWETALRVVSPFLLLAMWMGYCLKYILVRPEHYRSLFPAFKRDLVRQRVMFHLMTLSALLLVEKQSKNCPACPGGSYSVLAKQQPSFSGVAVRKIFSKSFMNTSINTLHVSHDFMTASPSSNEVIKFERRRMYLHHGPQLPFFQTCIVEGFSKPGLLV